MIVRALFTLIALFLIFKLYQRMFQQKRCVACSKLIHRDAAICYHCNTIQDGVELMQAKVGNARITSGSKEGRKGSKGRVLLSSAVVLIALGVAIAVWFM